MAVTNVESFTTPRDNLPNDFDPSVTAREIDFITRFTKNWDALREIFGIMRPIQKAPGTQLVSYTAKVTLEDGDVDPGCVIPFSKYELEKTAFSDITLKKYAKAVTLEDVLKYGSENAVERSDEEFLNELQNVVLTSFYTFLNTGTGAVSDAATFQDALAKAKGYVVDKFNKLRKTVTEVVGFANVLDFYDYLGAADVTVQTAFGLTYIKNFLGYGTLILLSDPDIARGTVIALPKENIDLYYVNPAAPEIGKLDLKYRVDGVTPLLGFATKGNYSTAVGESYAIMGMTLWAEYLDGIAVAEFGE